ncbi:VanZ family protein [Syntrophomonas wolfei]|uniref:VanZ-like domain-containing protein n=1 Tax=Syntrophomonas wolfei subsp. wolfei (strain DSM 2245B / Goettingen) TaxID=335541 RepID=Q0AYY9_SYNWW|nr:VanZ family protein [Syntrophomonas wolfei]ABI68065.1 hypothetical protein Swol_0743 [Syntrophomonas wolfei subsp. wolfei str. Goettingen G311]
MSAKNSLSTGHNTLIHNKRHDAYIWIWLLINLIAIGCFSNQEFARQDLSGEIERYQGVISFVQHLPPVSFDYYGKGVYIDNRNDPVGFIQFILRKLGHLFLYGCLSLGFLLSQRDGGKISARGWLLAFMVVLLVAAVDEFSQVYVAGRSGSIKDVGVDAAAFLLVSVIIIWRQRKQGTGPLSPCPEVMSS